MKKILLFVALALIISGIVYNFSQQKVFNTHQEIQSEQKATNLQPSPQLPALKDYVEALNSAYRLQPDQRFLKAVAEIHAFLTQSPLEPVKTTFASQQWELTYQGKTVGTLPEYPDFQDFLELLSTWARQLAEQENIVLETTLLPVDIKKSLDTQLQQFFPLHVASAANELNQLWNSGHRSTELFAYATQALTLLVLQQLDKLGTTEQLPVKAITFLVLTKTLSNYDVNQEEALLAYLLGYSTHAEQVSLSLTSAVHHYVHHEGEKLKAVVEVSNANLQAHYLYLLWLAGQDNYVDWRASMENYLTAPENILPLLKTGIKLNEFGTNKLIASTLPHAAALSLSHQINQNSPAIRIAKLFSEYFFAANRVAALTKALQTLFTETSKVSTLIDSFEWELELLKGQYTGPFLPGETYAAYFQGYFYSGLYQRGLHYLDSLSSEKATTEYAALLGNSSHPIAANFQRWYRTLAQSKAAKGDPQRLLEDMTELTYLGVAPRLRTLEEQEQYFTFGSPEMMKAVRTLVPYLDSRPEYQAELLDLAWNYLLDLPLTEKLGDNVIKMNAGRSPWLHVWLAYFKRDQDTLLALLKRSDLGQSTQVKALDYLKKLDQISPQQREKAYRQVFEKDTNNWYVAEHYIDFLLETKQFKKARNIASDWFDNNYDHPSLKPVMAQVKIAKSYLKEGDLDNAWQFIAPLIETYQAGAMMIAAEVLEAKGDLKQAEEVSKAVYQRYPDNLTARLALTSFYWRQGDYQKAADTLSQGRTIKNAEDWNFYIGESFVKALASDDIALQAYDLLVKGGIKSEFLLEMSRAATRAKRLQLANQMLAPLKYPGLGQAVLYLKRYELYKTLEGDTKALKWLEPRIPLQMRNPFSTIAYDQKQDELLWEFLDESITKGDIHATFVWLMRAAAYLREPTPNQTHYQLLQDYYSQAPHTHYNVIGRYLLGMDNEDELSALMINPKAVCETAYYVGFKAQTEGRYLDASNWYRISIETGLIRNGEYRWAYSRLYTWRNKNQSLFLTDYNPEK